MPRLYNIEFMDNILKYKDFIATVKYSEEDEAFIGRIEGISSVVSFEGQSVEELKSAFLFVYARINIMQG